MSIWCSWETIGTEYPAGAKRTEIYTDGTVLDRDDTGEQRGVVASYANGWSNHYPDPATEERPASLDLAHIPSWCVPGHRNDDDFEGVGPWLRLSVDGFTRDWHSGVWGSPFSESVVLDEEAATLLRDDLTEWLDRPKARPRTDEDGN